MLLQVLLNKQVTAQVCGHRLWSVSIEPYVASLVVLMVSNSIIYVNTWITTLLTPEARGMGG